MPWWGWVILGILVCGVVLLWLSLCAVAADADRRGRRMEDTIDKP